MKTSWKKKMKNKGGFTLIELLIVIGLLGALTALILPRLAADRVAAIEDIGAYNRAGTFRVLKQHKTIAGVYPSHLHTGYTVSDPTGTGNQAMPGLPQGGGRNLDGSWGAASGFGPAWTGTRALNATEVESLKKAGMTHVSFGVNGSAEVSTSIRVADSANFSRWVANQQAGAVSTFDGISVAALEAGTYDPGDAYRIVPFYVTPKAQWGVGDGGNQDWTKGNVEIGLDLAGQVPNATKPYGTNGSGANQDSVDFAYVMAFFLVHSDATVADPVNDAYAARLIGIGGPSGTVLNK